MTHNKIHTEIIEFQGYLAIATFFHYIIPGSLKIRTDIHVINFSELSSIIDESTFDSIFIEATRRWLQKGEVPFPGYCRSPGSGVCLPLLCNCKKLITIWNKLQDTKSKLQATIKKR